MNKNIWCHSYSLLYDSQGRQGGKVVITPPKRIYILPPLPILNLPLPNHLGGGINPPKILGR